MWGLVAFGEDLSEMEVFGKVGEHRVTCIDVLNGSL